MQWLITFLQVALAIGLFLLWRWLQKLPDAIHRSQEQMFQQKLDRELEQFKAELTRELERFRISQAQLQLRKTDEFITFAALFRKFLTDPKLKARLQRQEPAALQEITEKFFDLGVHLFFFASDETIKQYVDWRIKTRRGDLVGQQVLTHFGRLMVSFRKDLGYDTTGVSSDDFLHLIVNDWNDENLNEKG